MLSETIYSLQGPKILNLTLCQKPFLKGLSLEDKWKLICFLYTELVLQEDHTKVVIMLSAKVHIHYC